MTIYEAPPLFKGYKIIFTRKKVMLFDKNAEFKNTNRISFIENQKG